MSYNITVGNEVMSSIESFLLYYSFNVTKGKTIPTLAITSYWSAFLSIQDSNAAPADAIWPDGKNVIAISDNSSEDNILEWPRGITMKSFQVKSLNSYSTFRMTGDLTDVASMTETRAASLFKSHKGNLGQWENTAGNPPSQMFGSTPTLKHKMDGNIANAILRIGRDDGDVTCLGCAMPFDSTNSNFCKILAGIGTKAFPLFSVSDANGKTNAVLPEFTGTGCAMVVAGNFKKLFTMISPFAEKFSDTEGGTDSSAMFLEMLAGLPNAVTLENCSSNKYIAKAPNSPDAPIEIVILNGAPLGKM